MKRIIVAVLLITIIAAGAFCQNGGQNGTIRELTGDVELKHTGAAAFVSAAAGDSVAANTVISTGFRSTAVITVRPLTRLTLAEIQSSENAENVNVNLQTGRVRVEVKPPAGTRTTLSVQSPSATASVRGTILEMDPNNLETIEGKVVYKGRRGPGVSVTAGKKSSVGKDGSSSEPVNKSEESLMQPFVGVSGAVPLISYGDVDVIIKYPGSDSGN
ncbi:MAG: FecR domain-containing protein [Treponema sp.]|nr:FecR domain-containing protein [Treponema sp.]